MQYRPILQDTPVVVKNLIIINVLMLLATYALEAAGIDFTNMFGMHYPASEKFRPFQIITHMFMHGGFMHLFFNMFALWMFGRVLESIWGPKRFLIYYFVTGLGAVALHMFVNHLEIMSIKNSIVALDAELTDVIVQHRPDEGAVEEVFVNTNAQSTLKLGQARGVCLLALARAGLPVSEYATRLVKKAIVGTGGADKAQVQAMLKVLLPGVKLAGADAADALAVAVTHASMMRS